FRLALVGPYTRAIADGEGAFFEEHGFRLAANVALDLPLETWATLEPEFWVGAVRDALAGADEVDGIVISCTNIRAVGAIAPLEAELGLPVVTSNQAAVWQILRLLGTAEGVAGYGRLLENPASAAVPA